MTIRFKTVPMPLSLAPASPAPPPIPALSTVEGDSFIFQRGRPLMMGGKGATSPIYLQNKASTLMAIDRDEKQPGIAIKLSPFYQKSRQWQNLLQKLPQCFESIDIFAILQQGPWPLPSYFAGQSLSLKARLDADLFSTDFKKICTDYCSISKTKVKIYLNPLFEELQLPFHGGISFRHSGPQPDVKLSGYYVFPNDDPKAPHFSVGSAIILHRRAGSGVGLALDIQDIRLHMFFVGLLFYLTINFKQQQTILGINKTINLPHIPTNIDYEPIKITIPFEKLAAPF
jgi:hypothetical protein